MGPAHGELGSDGLGDILLARHLHVIGVAVEKTPDQGRKVSAVWLYARSFGY